MKITDNLWRERSLWDLKDGRRKGMREGEGGGGRRGKGRGEERWKGEKETCLCGYSIPTDLEHNSVGIDARHVLHHHKVCFCDAEFDGNLPLRFYLLLVRRRKMVV